MTTWVIKIGTSVLRGSDKLSTEAIIHDYCKRISESKQRGDNIIIVTSGAVGLGCIRLGFQKRPQEITSLQAVAAIGQGYLMSLYEKYMSMYGFNVAQVLLTRTDFSSRDCYRKASMTLNKLLEWNVIPIVNENDTVSDEELRYGDNDTLSALVATSIRADQLILLTDIDRIYSSDPRINSDAIPINDVHNTKDLINISKELNVGTDWGTGGVITKLSAAKIATESGIKVHLADGTKPNLLSDILKGDRAGTVFHPQQNPLKSKKSWLAHALHPIGSILIDSGASNAIRENGASLLLVGIKKVEGSFNANQPVKIIDSCGKDLGRGISSLSSTTIQKELNNTLNDQKSPIVIHRDVLVLIS